MNTILVIEDDQDSRDNLLELLSLGGYETIFASDGQSGIELALRSLPNLILCDIMMPNGDGYEVLKRLSFKEEARAIPFIFITAKDDHEDLRKGMHLGADDYLTKPFTAEDLFYTIKARLQKHEEQQSYYQHQLEPAFVSNGIEQGFAALKNLVSKKKQRTYKAGQTIYYEGDPAGGVYLITRGKVKTMQMEQDGRVLITGIYVDEDYLGVGAVLTRTSHTETACSMEPTVLSYLAANEFNDLLDKYSAVSHDFSKVLASENLDQQKAMIGLAFHSVRKRLADAIVLLHGKTSDINLKAARGDLAGMAGIAMETVSRTLSDFIDEGLIERVGNRLHINNLNGLMQMKN